MILRMKRILLIGLLCLLAVLLPLSVFGEELSSAPSSDSSSSSSTASEPSSQASAVSAPASQAASESSRTFATVQVIEEPHPEGGLNLFGVFLWGALFVLLAFVLCYMVYHSAKVRKDEKMRRINAMRRPKLIITRGFTRPK